MAAHYNIKISLEDRWKIRNFLTNNGYTSIFFIDELRIRAYNMKSEELEFFHNDDDLIKFIIL